MSIAWSGPQSIAATKQNQMLTTHSLRSVQAPDTKAHRERQNQDLNAEVAEQEQRAQRESTK
jgi:hypothetical protein